MTVMTVMTVTVSVCVCVCVTVKKLSSVVGSVGESRDRESGS